MTIEEKLLKIQLELNAPKDKKNNFGGYNYRSAESILEAAKPLCEKYKCVLRTTEKLVELSENNYESKIKNFKEGNLENTSTIKGNGRVYVKSTSILTDIENTDSYIKTNAYAREATVKKGMDCAQITGATSSYAKKYCLQNLFNIDDNKDPDGYGENNV